MLFACNNFPLCAFLTMIYWTSTEVLLNLVAPLNSAVPSLNFEQINVFWTSGFDSVIIVFALLSVSRSLHELHFSHSIFVFLRLTLIELINIWFMALIPLALHSFLLWLLSFRRRLPKLRCSLDLDFLLSSLSKSFLFNLSEFAACLPLRSA